MPTVDIATRRLRAALERAGQPIEVRNTIPILGALRCKVEPEVETRIGNLELKSHRLVMMGCDLDTFVQATVSCEADESRSAFVLMDYRYLAKSIGIVGADRTTIESVKDNKGKRHTFTAGDFRLEIADAYSADDFPVNSAYPHSELCSAELTGSDLGEIRRVFNAISSEETRYYLNGVHMSQNEDGSTRFAATDGHRLQIVDLMIEGFDGELPERGIIIPRKAILLFEKAFRNADKITWRLGSNQSNRAPSDVLSAGGFCMMWSATVEGVRMEICNKEIDATYPDYNRVIPVNPVVGATMDRKELIKAVAAVSAHTHQKTKPVKLDFKARSGHVRVTHNTGDGAEAQMDIPCDTKNVPDVVGLHSRYLLQAVAPMSSEEVLFKWAADDAMPHAPLIIEDPSKDDRYLCVQMPMRV